MERYGEETVDGKPEWPGPDLVTAIRDFFEHHDYDVTAVHLDVPGKDLITVEDEENTTITWEGGDEFGYIHAGEHRELEQDHELYGMAADLMAAYHHGIRFDDDLNDRYAMSSHANSPGFSYAINNPMEWGVENNVRHWNEKKEGPIEKIKELLGS